MGTGSMSTAKHQLFVRVMLPDGQHLCQMGKDYLCEDRLYEGTSKFAEGYGTSLVFGRAKEKGMNVTIHWMDKNSSSAK